MGILTETEETISYGLFCRIVAMYLTGLRNQELILKLKLTGKPRLSPDKSARR
jgi:hypothetical protein